MCEDAAHAEPQIARGTPLDPTAKQRHPWRPASIALITFCFSILPGGIMHALNYERLGQGGLKRPRLLTVALAFLFCFGLQLADIPGLALVAINLGFAMYIYDSQRDVFEKHVQAGGQTAGIWRPAIWSFLGWVLVRALVALLR